MTGHDAVGPQIPLGLSLAPGATFEAFFPGPNGFAVELLQSMAEGEGEPQAFLASAPGLGKSHLLQAACHAAAARGATAAYLPLGGSLGERPEVLEGLEAVDLVALDDVDAVAGDVGFARALFVLINAARASGTRLLFAARGVPAELTLALADLGSRLAWGPVVQLAPLPDDTKRTALAARAAALGLALPDAVAEYLLRHYPRDLAEQLARLERLDRASLATGRRLTVPFVKRVLGE